MRRALGLLGNRPVSAHTGPLPQLSFPCPGRRGPTGYDPSAPSLAPGPGAFSPRVGSLTWPVHLSRRLVRLGTSRHNRPSLRELVPSASPLCRPRSSFEPTLCDPHCCDIPCWTPGAPWLGACLPASLVFLHPSEPQGPRLPARGSGMICPILVLKQKGLGTCPLAPWPPVRRGKGHGPLSDPSGCRCGSLAGH